jgi:hypothetical protein
MNESHRPLTGKRQLIIAQSNQEGKNMFKGPFASRAKSTVKQGRFNEDHEAESVVAVQTSKKFRKPSFQANNDFNSHIGSVRSIATSKYFETKSKH